VKALRLHGSRDLRLHEELVPEPGEGELLLRVTAVGLCGSDRHWFVEGSIGDAVLSRPLVLGHEFVATVEAGPREAQSARVETAFEVAGEDAALEDALDAVAPGGRVVLVGIPDGDRTCFTAATARRKGLTLLLSRRMQPADLPRAIRLVEEGRVELGPLVSRRYALSEGQSAFADLVERRGLKTILEPQRASGSAP
jgi:threonine dehydrogenase-like Zn-dependent dehydrogenase